jgi:hypothetical protein
MFSNVMKKFSSNIFRGVYRAYFEASLKGVTPLNGFESSDQWGKELRRWKEHKALET